MKGTELNHLIATGEDRCEPNYFHLNWQTEHTLEGIALQVCNFRALSADLSCTFSAPTCSLTRNTSFFLSTKVPAILLEE